MLRFYSLTTIVTIASATFVLFANQETQPADPLLPAGHPAVSSPPTMKAPAESKPEDVLAIGAIIDAYYASVSGPKGQARDWERFLSLFMPDARLIIPRVVNEKVIPFSITPQEFVDSNRKYFEGGGYFEKDIHRKVDAFGRIAQVFSTYASRRAEAESVPYSRGINSFQLMNTGDRWYITSIMWDNELPQEKPIPLAYLPSTSATK